MEIGEGVWDEGGLKVGREGEGVIYYTNSSNRRR